MVNTAGVRVQANTTLSTFDMWFWKELGGGNFRNDGQFVFENVPLTVSTIYPTFSQSPIILEGGARYYIQVAPGLPNAFDWYGNNPPLDPSGLFSFVAVTDGVYANRPNRPSISIDADPVPAGTAASIGDNRLNSVSDAPYQTAAVYCGVENSIQVYGIRFGEGYLAFLVTQDEIDAVGIPPIGASEDDMLIKQTSDGQIRLYRLPTGEFQVNAPIDDAIRGNLPNGYVFIWDGCQ